MDSGMSNIAYQPDRLLITVIARRTINEKLVVRMILNISRMVVCLMTPAKDLKINSKPQYIPRTIRAWPKATPKSNACGSKLNLRKYEMIKVENTIPPSIRKTSHRGRECFLNMILACERKYSIVLGSVSFINFDQGSA